MTEAERALNAWRDLNISPVPATYKPGSDVESDHDWALHFADGSSIWYSCVGGHECFIANNANHEQVATW